MPLDLQNLTLLIIVGTLAAIVYSLRVLVLLEKRIARMDENLIKITQRVEKEELKIEKTLTKKIKRPKAKPKAKPKSKKRRR